MCGNNNIDDDSNSTFYDDSAFDFSSSPLSNSFSSSVLSILLEAIIEKEHEVFMNSKITYDYVTFEDEMVIDDLPDNDDEVIIIFGKVTLKLLPTYYGISLDTYSC
jgi:hypothetical protein